MIVSQVVEQKKCKMVWKCNICFNDFHSNLQSILCDGCLLCLHVYHLQSHQGQRRGSAGHAVDKIY